MNSSPLIKQEYFELIIKLNQANKHKDQKTDIYFYIDSTKPDHLKLFAAISDSQKILLCHKLVKSKWKESRASHFENLEQFLAQLLRYGETHNNLTNYIRSHIFKLTS